MSRKCFDVNFIFSHFFLMRSLIFALSVLNVMNFCSTVIDKKHLRAFESLPTRKFFWLQLIQSRNFLKFGSIFPILTRSKECDEGYALLLFHKEYHLPSELYTAYLVTSDIQKQVSIGRNSKEQLAMGKKIFTTDLSKIEISIHRK